ncbi:MAG: bifunctional diguanylate cyclase/phosphodiesterase, partial [Pseudomonadota bacterium]
LLLEDLEMVLWASADADASLGRFLTRFRGGLALLGLGIIAIIGLLFGGRRLLTQYEAALLRQAYVDDLTGLPNRAVIVDRVLQLVEVCRRQEWHMAYILMDIDHFKRINDARGHAAGDRVLTRLGRRLRARLPAEVAVARVGGDEFSLFFASGELNELRVRLAEILDVVREPIDTREGPMHVSASMGVAIYPEDGDDPAELHRKADTALHQAKAYGRDRWTIFSSDLDVSVSREIQLIDRLRDALVEDRMNVSYQPIVNARTGAIDAVEVLARWQDEELGTVSPTEFIPVAESAHLIDRLTERVIEHTARDLVDAIGTSGTPLLISINVSAVQLADPDFARWFGQTCSRVGLKLTRITVELTESALIEAADEATLQIRMLRAAGCRVVLDDFGTGYSSIAYLRRMPLDAIKIDRQFVATVDQPGSIDLGLVQGILSMATPMGLAVVAEGIERESQADALRAMGAEWFQGHHFSPPVDAPTLASVIGESAVTAGD